MAAVEEAEWAAVAHKVVVEVVADTAVEQAVVEVVEFVGEAEQAVA